MRFPGRRKSKHYFPVSESGRVSFDVDFNKRGNSYVVGIDQLLVDIEVHVEDSFLEQIGLLKGESTVFPTDKIEGLYYQLKNENRIVGEYAGGAIGNTLHNYSVLSDGPCYALGAISESIKVGDYAFKYICTTNSHVDFSHLMPAKGLMGMAFCFVTPDGERSFAISKGIMNSFSEEFIPTGIIENSSALLISAYLLREVDSPIYRATIKATEMAKEANVPVVLSLGSSYVVESSKEFLTDFIKRNVNVLACNEKEAQALVGQTDALLAAQSILDLTDMVLLTVGAKGLYLCGHIEQTLARATEDQIHSKSIPEYNKYEYSRCQRRSDCQNPIKTYTHINPYLGGPLAIKNTNGAGDAALSALLHDMAANNYHREMVPNSPKHVVKFLTYSSIHQISKYCNRVSYEVLVQNSPRLSRGLPLREDCLEESYWAN